MNTFRNGFTGILIYLVVSQFLGCAVIVQNAVESSAANSVLSTYPTFKETETSWPEISEDSGRLVIYWSTAENKGFGERAIVYGEVTIDTSIPGRIGNQTFIFIDLDVGDHTIEFNRQGPLFSTIRDTTSITISQREIVYVEIVDDNYIYSVAPAFARESLKESHHNYKTPLPFNKQPKESVPAY